MAREPKTTPIVECRWASVHEPKPAFTDPATGKPQGNPRYEIEIVFDPKDAEMKEWASEIQGRVKEKKYDNNVVKPDTDENGEPNGRYFVRFRTGEQYPPRVFDTYGNTITPDTMVGNGSKVQVSYNEAEYSGFGGGITLYFNAVCVRELVEYKADDGFEFDTSDSGNGSIPAAAVDAVLDAKAEKEDDLPF